MQLSLGVIILQIYIKVKFKGMIQGNRYFGLACNVVGLI